MKLNHHMEMTMNHMDHTQSQHTVDHHTDKRLHMVRKNMLNQLTKPSHTKKKKNHMLSQHTKSHLMEEHHTNQSHLMVLNHTKENQLTLSQPTLNQHMKLNHHMETTMNHMDHIQSQPMVNHHTKPSLHTVVKNLHMLNQHTKSSHTTTMMMNIQAVMAENPMPHRVHMVDHHIKSELRA